MTHPADMRLAHITEAGSTRDAATRPWPSMVKGAQHHTVSGTLNGQTIDFRVTSGAGRHYAYFEALGQVWYADTGAGLLSAGAAVEFDGARWDKTLDVAAPAG